MRFHLKYANVVALLLFLVVGSIHAGNTTSSTPPSAPYVRPPILASQAQRERLAIAPISETHAFFAERANNPNLEGWIHQAADRVRGMQETPGYRTNPETRPLYEEAIQTLGELREYRNYRNASGPGRRPQMVRGAEVTRMYASEGYNHSPNRTNLPAILDVGDFEGGRTYGGRGSYQMGGFQGEPGDFYTRDELTERTALPNNPNGNHNTSERGVRIQNRGVESLVFVGAPMEGGTNYTDTPLSGGTIQRWTGRFNRDLGIREFPVFNEEGYFTGEWRPASGNQIVLRDTPVLRGENRSSVAPQLDLHHRFAEMMAEAPALGPRQYATMEEFNGAQDRYNQSLAEIGQRMANERIRVQQLLLSPTLSSADRENLQFNLRTLEEGLQEISRFRIERPFDRALIYNAELPEVGAGTQGGILGARQERAAVIEALVRNNNADAESLLLRDNVRVRRTTVRGIDGSDVVIDVEHMPSGVPARRRVWVNGNLRPFNLPEVTTLAPAVARGPSPPQSHSSTPQPNNPVPPRTPSTSGPERSVRNFTSHYQQDRRSNFAEFRPGTPPPMRFSTLEARLGRFLRFASQLNAAIGGTAAVANAAYGHAIQMDNILVQAAQNDLSWDRARQKLCADSFSSASARWIRRFEDRYIPEATHRSGTGGRRGADADRHDFARRAIFRAMRGAWQQSFDQAFRKLQITAKNQTFNEEACRQQALLDFANQSNTETFRNFGREWPNPFTRSALDFLPRFAQMRRNQMEIEEASMRVRLPPSAEDMLLPAALPFAPASEEEFQRLAGENSPFWETVVYQHLRNWAHRDMEWSCPWRLITPRKCGTDAFGRHAGFPVIANVFTGTLVPSRKLGNILNNAIVPELRQPLAGRLSDSPLARWITDQRNDNCSFENRDNDESRSLVAQFEQRARATNPQETFDPNGTRLRGDVPVVNPGNVILDPPFNLRSEGANPPYLPRRLDLGHLSACQAGFESNGGGGLIEELTPHARPLAPRTHRE